MELDYGQTSSDDGTDIDLGSSAEISQTNAKKPAAPAPPSAADNDSEPDSRSVTSLSSPNSKSNQSSQSRNRTGSNAKNKKDTPPSSMASIASSPNDDRPKQEKKKRSGNKSPSLLPLARKVGRENSFHSTYSAKTAKSHQSGSSHHSDSDDGKSVSSHRHRHGSMHQQRLEDRYNEEIKRGLSSSVHHHQIVRLTGKATVDEQLKQLGDINKPQDHQGLDMASLVTHDRVISADQRRAEEEREWRRKQASSIAGSAINMSHCDENSSSGEKSEAGQPAAAEDRTRSNIRPKIVEDVRSKIRRFIEASELEIIVQVEGIEARSSDTFQARHSYSLTDIVFDQWFEKCIYNDPETGIVTVDLDKFHVMTPVSEAMVIQSCL